MEKFDSIKNSCRFPGAAEFLKFLAIYDLYHHDVATTGQIIMVDYELPLLGFSRLYSIPYLDSVAGFLFGWMCCLFM